ncbi:MAG: sensor domain-containing diguanylate cyclase [Candidatus Latescibacteria bacterium]|nr:sensor domain-containing diguanylate cyclase [Candidatus Latescibacterota bacterium]
MELTGEFFKKILEDIRDGFYIVDRDRMIAWWNNGAAKITGFDAGEVVGKKCSDSILQHVNGAGANICEDGCPLMQTMKDGEPRDVEVYLNHKNGNRVPVLVRVTPIMDDTGGIIGAAELFSDISTKAHYIEKIDTLRKMAMFDPVTHLPNRKYIEIKLYSFLEELREHGVPVGLLLIELDNFKYINDRYGSTVGDNALRVISQTMQDNSQALDVIGRWGGVRFMAIIDNTPEDQLFSIANTLRVLIQQSIPIKGDKRYRITASMGIVYANANDTVESFIKRAEQLVAISQKSGRNRVTTTSSNILG